MHSDAASPGAGGWWARRRDANVCWVCYETLRAHPEREIARVARFMGVPDDAATVAWTEVYDDGFKVVVHGKYDARDGRITARFTSSRGVRGSFALSPKPSVF